MQDLVATRLKEVDQQLQSGSPLIARGPVNRSRYFALKLREIEAEMSCLYRIRDARRTAGSATLPAFRTRELGYARG